jgi:hypothetical protein
MSSTNSRKSLLPILGGILILALMAVTAIRSGRLHNFIDPSGLLFVLNVIINEEGFFYKVKGNPGNNPILEQAAIPAVKRWRFSPYLRNGIPVAIMTTVTVDFASK